jgi:aconitate hydratase
VKGTIVEKILKSHLKEGALEPGREIAVRIDQTLMQDATGTMACLEFEAMGVKKIKTELSVIYVDHNTLQTGFENMDDHLFLQSCARKWGLYFSRPGNGICHQVHLERFSAPGKTLLGSDSHTPTSGGAGMLAIGAGGLDVACAMGGYPFYLRCPEVIGVRLSGELNDWVSAKDVILDLLRRLTTKGGVGKALEYFGPGVKTLSVPERATITNMGTETGATGSVFPSDEVTRKFFRKQGRSRVFKELAADPKAKYGGVIEIDLSKVEPLAALPGSPDNVRTLKEAGELAVGQVNIGSCTNSSFQDLSTVAAILKGRKISEQVSLSINPGSRQVLKMLADSGALAGLIEAGARVYEPCCDGCIGMGSAPATGIVSVRTYNRNFPGRSGTSPDQVFLVSPETAAAAALSGKLRDPRKLGKYPKISESKKYFVDDSMVIAPSPKTSKAELVRGPNIRPLPEFDPLPEKAELAVLIKVGNNITTDDILPGGSKILPFRSNLHKISEYVFSRIDAGFARRAKEKGGGVILGGENYGQGSSREHAALAPNYLGVRAVLAISFARIHRANLINFGIVPVIISPKNYSELSADDRLSFPSFLEDVKGSGGIFISNQRDSKSIEARLELSSRERHVLAVGGLLNFVRKFSRA